jgi:hypothetical protein
VTNLQYHKSELSKNYLIIGNSIFSFLLVFFKGMDEKVCNSRGNPQFLLYFFFFAFLQYLTIRAQITRDSQFYVPLVCRLIFSKIRTKIFGKSISPSLKLPESQDPYADVCSICLEKLGNSVSIKGFAGNQIQILDIYRRPEMSSKILIQLDCKHSFHTKCLVEWILVKEECPVCRREVRVFSRNFEEEFSEERQVIIDEYEPLYGIEEGQDENHHEEENLNLNMLFDEE